MSIVSHTVSTSPQSSTRMNVVYDFLDHVGGHTFVRKLVQNAFDTNADALSMYDRVAEGLAEGEESKAVSDTENGEDVLADVTGAVHSTPKKMAKKLIYHMMRTRDPYLVIALEPLIVYLRANYTNAQLIVFLDLTAAQATKMNSRINAILDNKSVFTTYDDNAEDIE